MKRFTQIIRLFFQLFKKGSSENQAPEKPVIEQKNIIWLRGTKLTETCKKYPDLARKEVETDTQMVCRIFPKICADGKFTSKTALCIFFGKSVTELDESQKWAVTDFYSLLKNASTPDQREKAAKKFMERNLKYSDLKELEPVS